jgi:anti-anti-sigma factor
LHCLGDEDRCTQGFRRAGFARAIRSQRDVIVDLRELAFADASMMLDLAALARRLRARGQTLRLFDPQPQIMALIEITGLNKLSGIQLESSAAIG